MTISLTWLDGFAVEVLNNIYMFLVVITSVAFAS